MKATVLMVFGALLTLCHIPECQNLNNSSVQNNTMIRAKLNENFEVKLEACHDGGYSWFLEPVDTTKIHFVSQTIRSVSGKPNIKGGNVIETWTFTGLQPGDYVLVFSYKRPWLDKVEKTEQVDVGIY
jgi:predicted secreted protein